MRIFDLKVNLLQLTKDQKLSVMKSENTKASENLTISRESKKFIEKVSGLKWKKDKHQAREEIFSWAYQDWRRSKNLLPIHEIPEEEEKKILQEFQDVVSRNEIEAIEDFEDGYPMYFEKSEELSNVFMELEENNLNLVQTNQVNEQLLQQRMEEFESLKLEKEANVEWLLSGKDKLLKEVDSLNRKIKQLEEKKKKKIVNTEEGNFQELERCISDIIQKFEDDLKSEYRVLKNMMNSKKKENLVYLLEAIENLLVRQITSLQQTKDQENVRTAVFKLVNPRNHFLKLLGGRI